MRADDSIAHEWPVARCLQAEVQLDQKSYLLSAGKWYQIDEGFVESIDKVVAEIPTVNLGLPEYEDKTEGDYNKRAMRQSKGRLALLDADNVRHGGSHSQVEFCDLYSCDRDLIHLNRYSSSATLSHLFRLAHNVSKAVVFLALRPNFQSLISVPHSLNHLLPRPHPNSNQDTGWNRYK